MPRSPTPKWPGPVGWMRVEQVRHSPQPFHKGLQEVRNPFPLRRLDDGDSADGEQPDHGAHLQPRRMTVGKPKDVVVEPILLVPHAVRARPVHRAADPKELLGELRRQVLVGRIARRQLHADLEHVLTEQRHPGRPVGLLEIAPGRQRRAAVEDADVVQAEEAALIKVLAEPVLAVRPPGEIQRQLGEGAREEREIRFAAERLLRPMQEDRGPGMNRRVDVAEIPLVGGNLSGRMQVKGLQHQFELALGEIDVDRRERDGVKRQVPGGEPGIFPFVRHRNDGVIDHMRPFAVPRRLAPRLGRHRRRAPRATWPSRRNSIACSTAFPPMPAA